MLTNDDLQKLLSSGSGPRLDILTPGTATIERMARSLVSLANAQGGVLLVPLMIPPGHSSLSPDEAIDRANQAALMSEPHLIIPLPYVVNQSPTLNSGVLVIEVPSGLPHLYGLDGRFLSRSGKRPVVLTSRALRELLLVRDEGSWEAQSPAGCGREDLDWAKVEAYASQTSQVKEPTIEDLLLRRGCIVQQSRKVKPTYAGLLLFGKQPQRWVRGAETLAVRFHGSSMDEVFIRQTLSGTLPEQIRHAELFLGENVAHHAHLGSWIRNDEPPYPPGVLREAVVNAIAHREYRMTGNQIHILVFSDRVEVRSPGRLPGHVTLQNLMNERYSRNESVVQVLADMGYIERLGYGIDRMVHTMRERGHQPPKFEETEAGFMVTLYARPTDRSPVDNLPIPAQNQRMQKMLEFLHRTGRITNRDYQELCPDISPESLRRDFVDMVERGIIMRIGDKRGTYYILK